MGEHASRKKGSESASIVPGAPGMEAFWEGVAKGSSQSLVDPRVPGTPPDLTALLPYIDRDHDDDPVAMAEKVTAQLTESTSRANAFTRASAQRYVDALVAAMDHTDEREGHLRFLGTLDRLDDPTLRQTVLARFQAQTGRPLSDVIAKSDWYGAHDKAQAQALTSPARSATERQIAALPPTERAKLKAEARQTATQIADVVGRDSPDDKAQAHKLHRLLADKSPMQIEAIRAAVREQSRGNESLYEQLERSLSGGNEAAAIAALSGDPIYTASVQLEHAIGDAPRIAEILRALKPEQVEMLGTRFPASRLVWMSVAPDQQAEIRALVTNNRGAADGAKVADLLRDPLHGASADGIQLDEQSKHNREVRSTENILRELEKMTPAQLADARREWDAHAPRRGEKTWDAMIEERFGAGDRLTYLRIRALASGNKVEATALALTQGLRDHDQAAIDAALANPDLSSKDPDKRTAAQDHARAVAARFQEIDGYKQRAIAAMTGGDVASTSGDDLETALAKHYAHVGETQRFDTASDVTGFMLAPDAQAARRKKRARAAEVGTDELRASGSFSTATEIHRARAAGNEERVATILENQTDNTAVGSIEGDYWTKYGEHLFQQLDSEKVGAWRDFQALRGNEISREDAEYALRDSIENRVHAVHTEGPRAARSAETELRLAQRERAHQQSDALEANELVRTMVFGRAAGSERRVDWALANEADAVDGPRAEFDQHVAHTRAMSDMQRDEKIAMADRAAQWIAIAGKIAALVTLNPAAMAVIDTLVGFATIYVKGDIQGEAYKTAGADLLDMGITVLNDLAMLPILKIESALLSTAATLGLSSGTIIVRNDLTGRAAETTIDLVKNLVLSLVGKGSDKLQDALGGVAGKTVNVLTNAASSGAVYGGDATTLLDAGGGHLAKGKPAKHAHPHDPSTPRVRTPDEPYRLSSDDHDDATRLATLRRRRADEPAKDADDTLDRHIDELETKLGLRDDAPEHAPRRHAIEAHLAAKRTDEGNNNSRYQTRAELVPGSDFRGRGEARPDAVQAEGMRAVEVTLRGYPDVASVQLVDASRARTPDKRARLEATYLVTLKPDANGDVPAPFTIRVAVGPHEGETVARTVINPSQRWRNNTPGNDTVTVRGRYVIQLSDELDAVHVERAVAHEIAELRAVRTLYEEGRYAGVDALRRGSIADELSPHDRGRLAELDVLARGLDVAVHSPARSEILALVEHLGLRSGEHGADARFELAKALMSPEAVAAVAALRKAQADLPDDVAADLHAIIQRAAHDHVDEALRAEQRQPAHSLPSSLDEYGRPMSRDALAARAEHARVKREAKSDETWTHLAAAIAAAPPGEIPVLRFEVQIGAGASMAARDRNHLVIDDRGRWQADGNPEIAQTATQSRGMKDANLGDATQVAKPDQRVPRDAIAAWEDDIAAQGPVVNGRAELSFGPRGDMLITISRGSEKLTFRLSNVPYVATGFPPEKMTGSSRGLSPRHAAQIASSKLAVLGNSADPALAAAAREARAKLDGMRMVSNEDARQLVEILGDPRLQTAVNADQELANALQLGRDSQHWHQELAKDDPVNRHLFLGDWANIGTEHARRAHNWVMAGTGGTGVSAAEIVLRENRKAHVTMTGADTPDGLMENDQFLEMAERHADPALAADLGTTPGDGRLSLDDPQYVGRVESTENDGTAHGSRWVDESDIDPAIRSKHVYDVNGRTSHARGTAYVAAIGRENDFPPVVASLVDESRRKGYTYSVVPNFHDRQYVGYTVTFHLAHDREHSIDVTGAASRFVPADVLETWSPKHQRDYERSADWDAPGESGRFAGGLEASAMQGNKYAGWRRARIRSTP